MADEYMPSDQDMEDRYVGFSLDRMDFPNDDMRKWAGRLREEFQRGLARVRRDAAREALDGLAGQYSTVDPGLADGYEEDAAEDARTYRDTHYPEETP